LFELWIELSVKGGIMFCLRLAPDLSEGSVLGIELGVLIEFHG